MQIPLISVIVPCYNQAQYLDECLQSVLDQTFSDWECIIVNDGSPDHTEELAKKWLEKDSRFKYLYKENGGLSSARNAGIDHAEGEWILPLDCDDKISADYLKLVSLKFCESPTIIYCEAEYFGEKSGKIELRTYSFEAILTQNIIFCSAFFQKKDWIRVGGYDEKLIYGLEDWEFWISIVDEAKEVIKIPETCFFYRIKKESMLLMLKGDRSKLMTDYIIKKHQKKYDEIHGSYLEILRKTQILKDQINYYNKSKMHRTVNKILKFYYQKN